MSDNIIVIINQSHSQSQSQSQFESESESPFRKLFGLNCNCIIRNYVEIVLIARAKWLKLMLKCSKMLLQFANCLIRSMRMSQCCYTEVINLSDFQI